MSAPLGGSEATVITPAMAGGQAATARTQTVTIIQEAVIYCQVKKITK